MQHGESLRSFAAAATQCTEFACELAKDEGLHEMFGVPHDTVRQSIRSAMGATQGGGVAVNAVNPRTYVG